MLSAGCEQEALFTLDKPLFCLLHNFCHNLVCLFKKKPTESKHKTKMKWL